MTGAIPKRKSIRSFREKKAKAESVKSDPIVGIGHSNQDTAMEAVNRFATSRIHYNKYS